MHLHILVFWVARLCECLWSIYSCGVVQLFLRVSQFPSVWWLVAVGMAVSPPPPSHPAMDPNGPREGGPLNVSLFAGCGPVRMYLHMLAFMGGIIMRLVVGASIPVDLILRWACKFVYANGKWWGTWL
jgi:hypothetical protein